VYNNGNDSKRVEFEHWVLEQLNNLGNLSFKIPTPVPSKTTGQPHVILSNGTEATLFHFIDGVLPKATRVRDCGRASGELVQAMGRIDIPSNLVSPNPRFSDLYKAHHASTREIVFTTIDSPVFNANEKSRLSMNHLKEEIIEIEKKLLVLQTLDLPMQLIHADLHYDNILCVDETVSGMLDFEFSVVDWRACEMAVALSKYAGELNALRYFTEFAEGYGVHGSLTIDEIESIPDLIILRVLSNVVYFIGRAHAGEDTLDILISKSETYYERIKWIHDNREEIIKIISANVNKRV
jgi:homoserine kinase type II